MFRFFRVWYSVCCVNVRVQNNIMENPEQNVFRLLVSFYKNFECRHIELQLRNGGEKNKSERKSGRCRVITLEKKKGRMVKKCEKNTLGNRHYINSRNESHADMNSHGAVEELVPSFATNTNNSNFLYYPKA